MASTTIYPNDPLLLNIFALLFAIIAMSILLGMATMYLHIQTLLLNWLLPTSPETTRTITSATTTVTKPRAHQNDKKDDAPAPRGGFYEYVPCPGDPDDVEVSVMTDEEYWDWLDRNEIEMFIRDGKWRFFGPDCRLTKDYQGSDDDLDL